MAFPVVRVCVAVVGLVRGQRLLLLFDACAITCGRSFTVLGVWGDLISFQSVLVFSPALLFLLFLLPSTSFPGPFPWLEQGKGPGNEVVLPYYCCYSYYYY